MSKSICIVTTDYITSNPRSVKEADCLYKAGYNVRVVFSQGNLEYVRDFDDRLLKEKPWRYDIVQWSPYRKKERLLYWKSKFRHNFVKRLPFLGAFKIAECAEGRVFPELADMAAAEKADLYVGHYPAGLAASAHAALLRRARFAYDVEDLHTEEGFLSPQRLLFPSFGQPRASLRLTGYWFHPENRYYRQSIPLAGAQQKLRLLSS